MAPRMAASSTPAAVLNHNSTAANARHNRCGGHLGHPFSNVAVALSDSSSPKTFDRHIKRLVWCALIGSLALVTALMYGSLDDSWLIGGVGAFVVITAVWAVVRDVSGYVRYEAARRAEVSRRSSQLGACQAAEAIQDRVANLLSVTVGYADLLTDDREIAGQSREHAQRVLDSAMAATRAVSTFRQSLGCGPSTMSGWKDIVEDLGSGPEPPIEDGWRYDELSRVIRTPDGTVVATLPDNAADRTGKLLAQSPLLLDRLTETQHVLATLLAVPTRAPGEAKRLQAALEQINSTIDGVAL
jgi:hypothetical protein